MAKIGIIGAGSWGTALAVLLHNNGNEVTVWSILKEEIEMLEKEREHKDKLPGVKLPADMKFTTDIREAAEGKELLVLAVPSPFTRSTSKIPIRTKGYILRQRSLTKAAEKWRPTRRAIL